LHVVGLFLSHGGGDFELGAKQLRALRQVRGERSFLQGLKPLPPGDSRRG
jgi:hypothetical protein